MEQGHSHKEAIKEHVQAKLTGKALKPNGDACSNKDECDSHFCSDGKCS